ncbi:L-lactate dehydrogenase, partial [Kocuria sp. CPCC 205290]
AQRLTGLPAGRVMSSGTVLDTSRLRWLLAQEGGVALSVPSVVGRGGVLERLVVPMDEREQAMLQRSAEAIRATLTTIGY